MAETAAKEIVGGAVTENGNVASSEESAESKDGKLTNGVNMSAAFRSPENVENVGAPLDFDIPSTSILCTLRHSQGHFNNNNQSFADPLKVVSDTTSAETICGENSMTSMRSTHSVGTTVCRICHNAENPEKLVSPCNCRGTLSHVHIYCLERWISTSRCTTCELCHFQYNTEQTLRYTCFQSLRIFYSRNLSRRALQEDCQMFSMLTLVAFGIIGTLLVGLQYYIVQGTWGLARIWTKGWLLFFLFTTLVVYLINVYMIMKAQLTPWYRWWQSARDIKLIIENRQQHEARPPCPSNVQQASSNASTRAEQPSQSDDSGITNSGERRTPPSQAASNIPTPQTACSEVIRHQPKAHTSPFRIFHKKLSGSGQLYTNKLPQAEKKPIVVQPVESYVMIV